MKISSFVIAASALATVAPAQAQQQQSQNPTTVVVGKAMTLPEWSARTTKVLEKNLRYPIYLVAREPREGIARVTFLCSDTGAPTAVTLADTSGFRELDAAAIRAVSRIRSLHPLPEGISTDQRYQAVILFANNQASYNRQMAALRDDAARRNAWFGQGSRMAMGISAAPEF